MYNVFLSNHGTDAAARWRRVIICLVVVFCLWNSGPAQTFLGSIGGTIRDASGAVVAGAEVKLTERATGIQRSAASNAEGNYHFASLAPGTYTVSASRAGFKEVRSSPITLTTQQTVRFDATLEVGDITQRVEVAAAAPTVNAENAQIGDVRPRADLLNLPMNTRATHSFLYLTSSNYEGRLVGGLRGNNLNYTIDGITSNAAAWGGSASPMLEVSLEAVQEVKVMSSNNAAEYPDVATMYVSTRSGSNQIHGGGVFDHSNNAFNARNFFAPSKPKGPIRDEAGGGLGGPVFFPGLYNGRDRTFFYFTWEYQAFPGQFSAVANVPTLKMRSGDFSELLPRTVVRDPATGQPFANNLVPAARISAVSRNIQGYENFIPAPNFGPSDNFSGNYRDLRSSTTHNNRVTVRVDHHHRNADSFSARVNLRQTPLPGQYDGSLPAFRRDQYRNERNAYLSETHLFSPTLVNEFRLGFARDHSRLEGLHRGADVAEKWGLQGLNLSNKRGLAGVPRVYFTNFSGLFEYGTYFWVQESFDMINNLTWTKGKHIVKAGVFLRRNRINISDYGENDFGRMNFDGFATGFDHADFLLGIPHTSSRYERAQPRYNRYLESGFFVQDDWRVSAKLTLNLGLRYEYFTPPVDKYDMRFAFDYRTGNLVAPNEQVLRTLVNPLFPKTIPIVTAQSAGFPTRALLEGDRNNFGPRLGFAYRPFSNTRTVVRGGYGVYYSRLTWSQMDGFSGGPFRSDENFLNAFTAGVPSFQFPRPFTEAGTVPTQSVDALVMNPRTPYTQQWNLTVEREIGASIVARIGYRGFRINQLIFSGNINKPFPSSDPAQRNFYRYPNFFAVNALQNGGIQKLHALDIGIERKFTQGLTFQSGWTWAKDLTDIPGGEEAGSIENPYDRSREMGNVDAVNRHRFVSSGIYELPFGTGKRFGARLPAAVRQSLGNWAISSILIFHSGQFLTPSFSGADPSNTRTTGGRPDRIGDWNVSDASITRWFNAAAFAVPPVGRFGNSARGVIVGPGVANFDFGLFKYFTIRERSRLQLRMTATNFFNHPNFGNPVTNISSGNVGKITSLRGGDGALGAGARTIRLGVRFDF
ncbi:MAG: TonB-dependent receptor [Acidobacteria bacterium]|nr:TonB-dependent receptor [Acidobacteriota bacterium]